MKKYTCFFTGCLFSLVAYSQYVTDYQRTGDMYFDKGNYYSAAVYYTKYLSGNKMEKVAMDYKPFGAAAERKETKATSSYERVVYRTAESYRLYKDFTNAEKWYAVANGFGNEYPLAKLWYGVSLRANKKYTEAGAALQAFVQSYPVQDEYQRLARKEIANIGFITRELANPVSAITLAKLGAAVNQGGANYAATATGNMFVFTSSRDSAADGGEQPFINALYTVSGEGNVNKLVVPEEKNQHQGSASFTKDGNRMYFTRWVNVKGENRSEIYMSERSSSGNWLKPVAMSADINMPGYSARQPFVAKDAYLIFSSDRPGGAGGFDLWYAAINTDGTAKLVTNLGTSINTDGNEQSPFYHTASGTLVYATDGKTGMGGFDLFQAKGDLAAWGEPVNMGYPVNSVKDDMYFYSGNEKELLQNAYLSSDRNSVCCLEIYKVSYTKPAPLPEPKPEPIVVIKKEVPFPVNTAVVLKDIYYDFDKASLRPESYPVLDKLAQVMNEFPAMVIELSAHTDSKGTGMYNDNLSDARARSCVDYLVSKGITRARLNSKGFGECCPVAPNEKNGKDNPDGRALNRRTELKVLSY